MKPNFFSLNYKKKPTKIKKETSIYTVHWKISLFQKKSSERGEHGVAEQAIFSETPNNDTFQFSKASNKESESEDSTDDGESRHHQCFLLVSSNLLWTKQKPLKNLLKNWNASA